MSRTCRQFYDEQVNALWPADVPKLTESEARYAAHRFWRELRGSAPPPIVITSGRRYNWVRRNKLYLNPGRGWRELVHDLSHYTATRIHPGITPHDSRHAYLERRMVQMVIDGNWLSGKHRAPEKPEKAKPNPVLVRYQRVLARHARWTAKLKRAKTALHKLGKQRIYYERKLSSLTV